MKRKIQKKFLFDGQKLICTSGQTASQIHVQDWNEIGIEVFHDDPLRSNFCLVINRRTHNCRVPNDTPVFKALLDYCSTLDSFDWQPLVQARSHLSHAYSVCWVRTAPALGSVEHAAFDYLSSGG